MPRSHTNFVDWIYRAGKAWGRDHRRGPQRRHGRQAVAFEARAHAAADENAGAEAERRGTSPRDKLTAAALDDAVRARLAEQLAQFPQVGRAWVARKVTTHAPDRAFYILGVSRAEPWRRFVSEGSNTYLARKLADELSLPGHTLILILTSKRRWLRRKLRPVPQSEIYRRRARSGLLAWVPRSTGRARA